MNDVAENNDEMFEQAEGSMTVDLSNVEDAGFDIIPKGVYDVVVDDSEFKISQAGGNPMISLTYAIEGGEYDGRKLFGNIVFSEKSMAFAKRDISRLGLAHLLEGPFNPEDKADDFIGARARVRVAVEKYEGDDTNRVKAILPAAGGDDFVTG